MDSGTTSNSAYFALRLDQTPVVTTDLAILSAITFPNNANFTVEAWVQPDERTDLDDNAECVVVRHVGAWELGFLGDGRVYGRWIYESGGKVLSVTLPSPDSVDTGLWLYISLTVSAQGQLSLYSSDTLIAQSPIQTGLQFSANDTGDAAVELGGDYFAGRLRNVTLSNRCKQVIRDQQNPSNDLNDFTESIFHASMHMLVSDAVAAINLLHPMGDPQNPSSAVPLCCLHLPAGTDGLPTMTPINVPSDPTIQLQSLTGARYLTSGGYIDCGLGVMTQPNTTFETWIMPGGPAGLPLSFNTYTIASCASMGDPGHIFNTNGFVAGWTLELKTTVENTSQSGPTVTLVFTRGGVNNSGALVSQVNLGILDPGKWLHLTVSGSPYIYATLNGKQLSLDSACNFVGAEAEHFPLIIGGWAWEWSWQAVQYKVGVPLVMMTPFEGAIKMVRIWNRALSVAEIGDLYNLQPESNDYSQLALYLDFDAERVVDLCMNTNVAASASSFHQAATTTVIALPTDGGNITDSQLLNLMGKEAQSRSGSKTSRSAFDPDQPLLSAFLGANNPWFNVIDVVGSILFVIVDRLTAAKLKLGKMADVLTTIFFRLGPRFAAYVKRITDAQGAGDTIHACLDIMYFIYNQGILKEIFLCFDLSYFSILKLLPRFIPYVGTVKLLADLLQIALDIGRVIAGFLRRSAPKLRPLAMMLEPDPLTSRQLLLQGQSMLFRAYLDHIPGSRQNMPVTLKSNPPDALTVSPSSFMLDESDWNTGVSLTVIAGNHIGSASIQTADGNKHIEFLVRPAASLSVVPTNITPIVTPDGTVWTFEANLIWDGPMEQDPAFTYTLADDDNTSAGIIAVKTVSESSDPPRRETRLQTKRKLIQIEAKMKQDSKKANLTVNSVQGGTATATVTKKDPEEWVDIYMINAGSGDAFYLHFKKKDYKENTDGTSTEVFHEATMIIDGGYGDARGELMWHEVAPAHLPQQLPPPATGRGDIDLVVCTHQDNDHIKGLLWMYEQMRANAGLGPAGTETTKPAMTWLNPTYGARKRSAKDTSGSIEELATATRDLSITTDPKPWPPALPSDRERASKEAAKLEVLLGTWPKSVAPAVGAPPQTIINAGAIVEYKAPNSGQVDTAAGTPGDGRFINSASIICEIEATNSLHYWNSLWTGDAWDKEENPSIRESIGLFNGATRHYTIMKVGHHGSEISNSEQFFADVTADHYLISSADHSDNPRRRTIQWILDGHAKMRAKAGNSNPPPKIWISNPINQSFTFDYKGGEIWQRNQSIDGVKLTREGDYGYLYFQIHNGAVSVTPQEHAIDANATNPDAPTRNTVVQFTNTKQIAMRAVNSNPWAAWIPLIPNDRSQLAAQEIQDLDQNATNAFYLRLTCSQPYGLLLSPEHGMLQIEFNSDLSTICAAGQLPPIGWVGANGNGTSGRNWLDDISCGSGQATPSDGSVCLLNNNEYVNGVDVWAPGPNPGGLLVYTNQGRQVSLGDTKSGSMQMQFRPPDSSYGLIGFRKYGYSGAWLQTVNIQANGIVGRFGVVWAPMHD